MGATKEGLQKLAFDNLDDETALRVLIEWPCRLQTESPRAIGYLKSLALTPRILVSTGFSLILQVLKNLYLKTYLILRLKHYSNGLFISSLDIFFEFYVRCCINPGEL
jgi:hypothetical protein